MTTDPEQPQAPRSSMRPGLRILLFASLALNLMVAGLFLGAVASGRVGDKPRMEFNLGPFMRSLGEEDRRAIIADVRSQPEVRLLSPRQRRAELVEMVSLLRADDFDVEAMTALLSRQRDAGGRIVIAAHDALVRRLVEAGPEARSAFADRLEAELRRGPGPDRDRDRDRDDQRRGNN